MSRRKPKRQGTCKHCGGKFVIKREWQIFCSPNCRVRWARTNKERCFYCYYNTATERDHILPVRERGRRSYKDETVPVCSECNSLLRDRVFDTFSRRCFHLAKKIAEKHKIRQGLDITWDEDELEELGEGLRGYIEDSLKTQRHNVNRFLHVQELGFRWNRDEQ